MDQNEKLKMVIDIIGPFLESLKYPVSIIDTEGKYVYYNQYDAEIDGAKIGDALGSYVLDFYTNLTEETSTQLRALRYGEEFINQHQVYHTVSGKIVDYIHTTLPLYDENKNIIGAIEIGRDIGIIKQLTNQVLDLSAKLYSNNETDYMDNSVDDCNIITENIRMKKIIADLDKYANTNFPLLIYGETGTGKELFVKRAHKKSPRAKKPFITLNCAAIPETLLESTLFGTVKGAFTGAENRKGMFEIANGGTIFLDELNSMPISLQSKLLRVLQDGEIMRLGSSNIVNVDVRVIAAMNEEPEIAVQKGHMREDLFYRLSVGLIRIPPLRQRKNDIVPLAHYFIKKYAAETNSKVKFIHPKVLSELEQYDWPGNVRMLENVIKRSLMLEDPEHIALNQLHFYHEKEETEKPNSSAMLLRNDESVVNNANNKPLDKILEDYERNIIINALRNQKGNIKQTAKVLQIPRTTLQYKIKKYNLKSFCFN